MKSIGSTSGSSTVEPPIASPTPVLKSSLRPDPLELLKLASLNSGRSTVTAINLGQSAVNATANANASPNSTNVSASGVGNRGGRAALSGVSRDFSARLQECLAAAETWEDAQAAAASALQRSAGCSFVGWFQPKGALIGQQEVFEGLTCPEDGLPKQRCRDLIATATQSIKLSSTKTTDIAAESSRLVGVRVEVSGGALTAVVPLDDHNCLTAVELAASRLNEWLLVREAAETVRESQHVAALVELMGQISACDTSRSAAQTLVDELKQYLGALHVYFGFSPDERLTCRLTSISGESQVDAFSEFTRSAEAVLQEAIARSAAALWPARDTDNRHALLSHQHFAETTDSCSVVSCPLRTDAGQTVGAIIATFGSSRTHEQNGSESFGEQPATTEGNVVAQGGSPMTALNFLHAGERILATALYAQRRKSLTVWQQLSRALKKVLAGQRLRNSLIAVGVLGAVLLVPMDYKVKCDVELQPVLRRFVAAPFDAPLEQCFVDPGDLVEADQILARLDGRELRWELAGVRADLGKATKEHNTFLSEQKFGEAAIARHEIERLEQKAALLSDRDHNLDIRSPIAGIIVSGDLRDTEGVPLKTGQSLFEVSPLDKMVVELAVPAEDIRHVTAGMTLHLNLDAMPARSIEATILRVHPSAELREHQNVFIAEAELENTDAILRPGMKGAAGISTGYRALGWNLFHKPVAHIVGWLGW